MCFLRMPYVLRRLALSSVGYIVGLRHIGMRREQRYTFIFIQPFRPPFLAFNVFSLAFRTKR